MLLTPLLKLTNIGKKHINAETITFASIPIPNINIISGASVMTGITCETIMTGIIVSKKFLLHSPISIIKKLKNAAIHNPRKDSIKVIQVANSK